MDAIGASGGIILLWDNRVVEKVEEAVGSFSVSCKFREVFSDFKWAFFGVYSPIRSVERWLLWEELSGISSWWGVPWCVGGDFNIVRYPSKQLGLARISSDMRDFSEFIFVEFLLFHSCTWGFLLGLLLRRRQFGMR